MNDGSVAQLSSNDNSASMGAIVYSIFAGMEEVLRSLSPTPLAGQILFAVSLFSSSSSGQLTETEVLNYSFSIQRKMWTVQVGKFSLGIIWKKQANHGSHFTKAFMVLTHQGLHPFLFNWVSSMSEKYMVTPAEQIRENKKDKTTARTKKGEGADRIPIASYADSFIISLFFPNLKFHSPTGFPFRASDLSPSFLKEHRLQLCSLHHWSCLSV
ncbi:hypothetical protein QQP08_016474 [Theobroma cacao]|nr:hypothetical protein QQP08_016474 [Theobroma cacao]